MKILIDRDALASALSSVSAACMRAADPVLACVLVDAQGEAVSFGATDLDQSARTEAPALVEEPGRALVPAKRLAELAKAMGPGTLVLEAGPACADLSSGHASARFPALDPGDFPGFAPFDGAGEEAVVDAALFADMARTVSPFASKDPAIPISGCVLVESLPGALRMVATDTYRVLCDERPCACAGFRAELPAAFLAAVAARAASSVSVALSASSGIVRARMDGADLSCRRVEGSFPQWERVFAGSAGPSASFDGASGIARALRLAACACGRAAAARLSFGDGEAHVECEGEDGRASDRVPCETDGAAEVKANALFLASAVEAAGPGRVSVSSAGPKRPIEVHGVNVRAAVMPVI